MRKIRRRASAPTQIRVSLISTTHSRRRCTFHNIYNSNQFPGAQIRNARSLRGAPALKLNERHYSLGRAAVQPRKLLKFITGIATDSKIRPTINLAEELAPAETPRRNRDYGAGRDAKQGWKLKKSLPPFSPVIPRASFRLAGKLSSNFRK